MTPEFKSKLKSIVGKHAATHTDPSDIDTVFDSTIPQTNELIRMFAEHPVAVNNVVPFLVEVQSELGIKTRPILKSMAQNMGIVKKSFLDEYDAVLRKTGSVDLAKYK